MGSAVSSPLLLVNASVCPWGNLREAHVFLSLCLRTAADLSSSQAVMVLGCDCGMVMEK